MNNVTLVGRLTRDPEERRTLSNYYLTTFTLAVQRPFQSEQEADFIRCVAWGKTASHIVRYCTKGMLVAIRGRIETYTYQDESDERRFMTQVVAEQVRFLSRRPVTTDPFESDDSDKKATSDDSLMIVRGKQMEHIP